MLLVCVRVCVCSRSIFKHCECMVSVRSRNEGIKTQQLNNQVSFNFAVFTAELIIMERRVNSHLVEINMDKLFVFFYRRGEQGKCTIPCQFNANNKNAYHPSVLRREMIDYHSIMAVDFNWTVK